jgi:hypothetical protein
LHYIILHFFLYEQKTLHSIESVQSHLSEVSGLEQDVCNNVIAKLIDRQYLLVEERNVSFGTNGLWFLENSYMQGEELGSALLVERALLASRFFTQP